MTANKVLNINVGLLGHVDCGKTSLAKCLSQVNSTACFDKHPQSQERGITIDLGFSAFSSQPSDNVKGRGYEKVQYTLVDCPGHASLIRTIIGGVHIIDLIVLVVDITKGIQTQTAECIIIAEIMKKSLIVVLNKIDLIEEAKRDEVVKKVTKKMEITLSETGFNGVPIIPVVCKEEYCSNRGIDVLIKTINEKIAIPERSSEKALVLAVDHCFSIKGKGTILTGTVLQGVVKVNDVIEIPALKEKKKIKSIQVFRNDIDSAMQGDRIGACVTHFNPKLMERGIVCKPGHMHEVYGVIIKFNKVKHFRSDINSNSKYHISVGYDTVLARITLFASQKGQLFNTEVEFAFVEQFNEEEINITSYYAFLEFEKSIYIPPKAIIIGSKLDANINKCRIAFFGDVIHEISDKNYKTNFLPTLKIYRIKKKVGVVQNVLNENEIIVQKMFQKLTSAQKFLNMNVTLSTGEKGYIESTFGQKDKLRIRIPEGLNPTTLQTLMLLKKVKKTKTNIETENDLDQSKEKKDCVRVFLQFKKYIFDNNKMVIQNNI